MSTNNYDDENQHILERTKTWNNLENWIHCICVVTFDLELGQALECVYPNHIQLTKQEASSVCYLAFPDSNSGCMGDTNFLIRFKTTTDTNLKQKLDDYHNEYNRKCPNNLQIHPSYLWGTVYFRQVKDQTVPRGYLQKSVVILTRLPFKNVFEKAIEIIAPRYFKNGEVSLKIACDFISRWSTPMPGERLRLLLFEHILQFHIPCGVVNSEFRHLPTFDTNRFDCSSSSCSSTSSNSIDQQQISISVDEINYFDILQPVLSHIHLLWELVLTTEPLVIMATSPTDCSNMVLALTRLIAPLKYYGNYHPYFTIHDREFKQFTCKSNNPPPAILGVTNPFFTKTLHHWPHTIRLDKSHEFKLKKNSTNNSAKISSNSSPGIYTTYKTFLQKDKSIIKKIAMGVTSKRPYEVQTALLKRHLSELSHSFLIPLERYIASLMPLQRDISPFKAAPNPLPFHRDDFFATLETTGPQLTSGIKGDWIGLYKAFLESPNFHGWYNCRYKELTTKLQRVQLDALSRADLKSWMHGKAEVEIVDMVLNLRGKISQCSNTDKTTTTTTTTTIPTTVNNDQIKERLNQRLYDIIASLPEDLKNILRTNS